MKICASLFVLFFLIGCNPKPELEKSPALRGDYFSQEADTTAQLFAEGIVSKEYQELNSVFSPDGKEFYYTVADPGRNFYVIMMYSKDENGDWQGPEVAPFSGKYPDADPYITSDNKQLYFISKRPVNEQAKEIKDFDIWKVDRTDTGWGDAIRLDTIINTSKNEFYVSATDDGSIFYSSNYEGGLGYGDIYEARPENGTYAIQNLGEAINSSFGEGDPYVSPDGNMIIFMSWGREDDMGRGDLYISYKKDGVWQKAQNLGPKINSPSFEYCPMMSPDGKYFFWTSYRSSPMANPEGYDYESYIKRLENPDNGLGNVYWIKAEVLEAFKPS
ncbi:MAG: hypothetical protein AAGA77_06750 [Bacteroidota bacterium]